MRKFLVLFLFGFFGHTLSIAQDSDASIYAPLEVLVTNFKNKPLKGESIIFEGIDSDLSYTGTSNSLGKFHLDIKGGETYLIKIKSIGKATDYSTFEVPSLQAGQEYAVSELTIQIELPKSFTLDNVHFATGKSELNKTSYTELNELVEYMHLKEDLRIEIAGHTDNVGEEKDNQTLSQSRSDRVKSYLISKGISEKRLIAKGYGETQPAATNDTPEGRQMNRRTEVRIIQN